MQVDGAILVDDPRDAGPLAKRLEAAGYDGAFTFEGRHVFNPSLFGVAVSLLVTRELITTAPAYQWAGGALGMSAFVIAAQ